MKGAAYQRVARREAEARSRSVCRSASVLDKSTQRHPSSLLMFGSLGFQEIAIILMLALLIFGPRKLPEIGKTLGRSLGEFKRATNDLKRSIEQEVHAEETKSTLDKPKETKPSDDDSPTAAARPTTPA
ncbi:MAG: twin-arginine translocase TatA/TatE family subunit [Acidobacteriota bacterium]|nr:twin-arginine translocase TatA/TatE family subunit [Acidobacteriota bacterium]